MRVTFDRGVVMHYVVLFAYRIMLDILRRRRELQKFYQRVYIVILNDLCNAIKKRFDKISFHRHFNMVGL